MSKMTPQIRFQGFTDDWEERKLGDISDVTKLAGFEFTKYVRYQESGKIIALRGLNVKNGNLVLDDVKYIDDSDFAKLNRSKLYKNDILLTYVGTVGELAIVPEDNKYFLAPNVARIRLQGHVSPMFVCQMMNDSNFYNRIILPLIATSSQPALSMENVRKFQLLMPDYQEQQKMGAFFKQLDNNIALHQRKLDLLKEQKKGFLQKMFPKNGAKVPELRFSGFADDWEERKLGELASVLTGFPFKNEDFVANGKYLVITNGNIQNDSSVVDVLLGNRIDDISDEIKERYYLNKNDILVTMDGTVGRTAKAVDDNLILAQRVGRLVSNTNPEFVYQWLNHGSFFNEMTKVSHGGTIKHISVNEISNYRSTVPSNNIEQQKIGAFFKQLDITIDLHQRKLNLLTEQKKGFLQKMFVS
ncbi:restriction endonuclease subunit S [Leuconostoc citreum]|uniref:restriction endonuclease subunit S n=1 Tax=Leuconostoc citreum TaxID=33964 RepID=UPI0032DE70BB